MEDFNTQLGKVTRTVREQDHVRNLGTIDLIALAELIEAPEDFMWKTKSNVPMEAGLKIKHQFS